MFSLKIWQFVWTLQNSCLFNKKKQNAIIEHKVFQEKKFVVRHERLLFCIALKKNIIDVMTVLLFFS